MIASRFENQLARVFEATSDARLMLDPQGRVLAVTDGYLAVTRCVRSQVLGNALGEVPPYGACGAIQAHLQAHLQAASVAADVLPLSLPPEVVGSRSPWTRAASTPIRGRADGAVQCLVHSLFAASPAEERGVSERERRLRELIEHSQNDLKQANEQLVLALQAARAMTWSFRSTGHNTVELVSGDFAGFFGVSAAAVREHVAAATVHPDDRQKVLLAYATAFRTGQDFMLEFRGAPHTPAENRHYIAHGRFAAQANAAGVGGLLVGVTWDVTERERMLQERAELDRHLRESQKLESLGVLAGGIAHDFNNLLTIVLGNVCIAQRQVDPASAMADQLRCIDEAARRASELCIQMLAYAGRGNLTLAPVSLNRLVEESTLLQVSLLKKIALRFALAPQLPSVIADQTQLRQVLINLVVNAAEAIGNKPGTITVSTGVARADACLLEGALVAPERSQLAQGYAYLEVVDDGPGMDDATLARIFEPFFTTKFTGRGLGLSAVLGIVRGHSGVLKVQSAPGAGARFLMALPLQEAAQGSVRPSLPSERPHELQGTVLLVDDDPLVLSVTKTMLDSLGLDVISARDGREAVELCTTHRALVSVVLMDLTMPTLDGAEALKELRELGVSVPVLLMSGYTEQETRSRLLGHEPYTFLQKPFGPLELRDRLLELLRAVQPDSRLL